MSKLDLMDTQMDAIIKMSDGNPGAISAIMDILEKHDSIDPQAAMGAMGALMMLDTWEIYGSDIYVLWSDKCDCDTRKMLMIMRSCQLGNLRHTELREMAADQMRKINLTDEEWQTHDDFVCGRLSDFKKPESVVVAGMIDISKLNTPEVLAALFNNSKQQGIGFFHGEMDEMCEQQAEKILCEQGTYFDYLNGKVMKVEVGVDQLDPRLYDRDNGEGAALRALSGLLAVVEAAGEMG